MLDNEKRMYDLRNFIVAVRKICDNEPERNEFTRQLEELIITFCNDINELSNSTG